MKIEYKLALRYLIFTEPNKKRINISFQTFFAIISIAIGLCALLITFTILNGFENEIVTKIQKFSSHVQISLFSGERIKDKSKITTKLLKFENEIENINYELQTEAVVSNNQFTEGVILKGIEPEVLNKYLITYKVEGVFENKNSSNTIFVGKKLLNNLNSKIGDEINLTTVETINGVTEFKNSSFLISGSFESGMSEYDDVYCFINYSTFQNIFQTNNSFNTANIFLKNPSNSQITAEKIRDELPNYYLVNSYLQLHRNLLSWINLQKGPTPIILGLIMLVGVFNIIGSQLLILLKRIYELGILRTLGLNQNKIKKIFLIQSLIIGLIGVIIGNILALGFSYVQLNFNLISLPSEIYLMNSVPILVDWCYYVLTSLITILLTVVASIIPAKISTKYSIVNTIRYS